jgi:DNA-directed RNA polymerase subunit K/omega
MTDRKTSRGTMVDTEKFISETGGNRFMSILMASARAREISRQHKSSEDPAHCYPIVSALLDCQEGRVGQEYIKKIPKSR